MRPRPRIMRALAVLLSLAGAAADAQDYRSGALVINRPWARATVTVQKVGAGYLTIRNEGAEADRLTGARATVAPTVELHTHEIDAEGVARMRQLEAIDLPAGASVELAPGGLHLMLIGLSGPLQEGQTFPLTLVFERAGEVVVEVAVRAIRGDAGGQHGQGG